MQNPSFQLRAALQKNELESCKKKFAYFILHIKTAKIITERYDCDERWKQQ